MSRQVGTKVVQKRKHGGRTLQEEADDNSWSNYFSNIWSALTSDDHLPKRFRLFIRKHGRDKITSIQMVRAPVARIGEMAMELLTLGRWKEFKEKAGVDSTYHTGIILNGNLVVEKLDKLEGRVDSNYLSANRKAEAFDVPLQGKHLTVAEFLDNGRRQMGSKFYTYDFLKSNCQDWVSNMVSANGLLTAEGRQWIKQEIDKLIQELPQTTKTLGVALTDTARDLGNVFEEVAYKRGGVRRRAFVQGIQGKRSF
jgi:hypothetical protein